MLYQEKTLKEIRTITGMTQEQFADKFLIPRRTYQNWEYNETKANSQARRPPVYIRYMIIMILTYEAKEKEAWTKEKEKLGITE